MNRSLMTSYRDQDWTNAREATGLMTDLDQRLGLDLEDYLFVYETRINEFQANPPGATGTGSIPPRTNRYQRSRMASEPARRMGLSR